ncbi:glycoside hydrolase family 15 protein [Asticcacaulis sp. BYS171W]|uniref:Glycoside hydrolase family 15 protein n=1 Tax=Asticcacaulis aquaticus TaxID=2984212 RepID=A0ABT5HZJ4_9CAUL|nr:glycoside hydrolase family 15 protein [Asticcacaulis aquaticus]MDC7684846.1 glycoside hydrolase family 15 protein [Asticcacaulis aquaticus]
MPDQSQSLHIDAATEVKPQSRPASHDLNLALIGNGTVSALIDARANWVWACVPRYDGDPMFSNLLSGVAADSDDAQGLWAIDLIDFATSEQAYERNSAVLRTVLTDRHGASLEITDFCPRFMAHERQYRPVAWCRVIRPLSGAPRIRVRLRPMRDYGKVRAPHSFGSNHIRYLGTDTDLRLTTNCPVSHLINERTFRLEESFAFFLGPDESFSTGLLQGVRDMQEKTDAYWKRWVRTLSLPLEWQEATIRAAIALKLCVYEETGAIVAAMTTSIPEAPDSGRNWDYRYCWIRDAYYVVQALTRLGAVDILENYLKYLRNIVDQAGEGPIQPVYGIGFGPDLTETVAEDLPGYRGMGPVRVGNLAYIQHQHDVYGQIVLSSVHAFFDQRLLRPGTIEDFTALEAMGERAFEVYDKPDAGLWEYRTLSNIHTYSALMCWAACDRLENAAVALGLTQRAAVWKERAQVIRTAIETRAECAEDTSFSACFDHTQLDASLLQMIDLRFITPDDPRHLATLKAVESGLRRGEHMLRYAVPDDFGEPETAFNFCTFWLIEALHYAGRTDEARDLFGQMLARRTPSGLLSEDTSYEDGTLWGNFPQTYSLVGIINCAGLLSRPWRDIR